MATNTFEIIVTGNLTRDPELRFTPSGSPVATFGIAVNRNYQDKKTSEWIENTEFFRVTTWFKLAENCAESLKKGDRVIVIGKKLSASAYEKDGQQRATLEITASLVAPSLEFATCDIKRNPKTEFIGETRAAQVNQIDENIEFTDEDIPF
ncbi:MAG: single-stranded DNA-binding protein [Actinobacteria bacterium]|nr:single-stranded DNA-binding protein [Cyanobacteriota bacterium]MCL5771222.1 single-stranded DNA-binding protein [Actinomycetota bacterium]